MGRARKRERTCKACGGLVKGHPGPTGYRKCQVVKEKLLQESRRNASRDDTTVESDSMDSKSPSDSGTPRHSSPKSQVSAHISSHASSKDTQNVTQSKERSRSKSSKRYNSTVKTPGLDKNDDKDVTPRTKLLRHLSLRVSEIADKIEALSTKEEDDTSVVVDRSRRRSRSVASCISPASTAGQSSQTAAEFMMKVADNDDDLIVEGSRKLVEGLKPVPAGVDLSTIRSAHGWPERTARKALMGEFTNLSLLTDEIELVQDDENYELVPNEGTISLKQKVQKKKISDFTSWLEAWLKYEKLLSEYHGLEVYLKIADYKTQILDFSKVYTWEAVQAFDSKHRRDLNRRSIDFCDLNHNTVTTKLNAASLKATKLNPQATNDNKGGNSKSNQSFNKNNGNNTGKRFNNGNGGQTPICQYYNQSRCAFSNCRKLHICYVCKGDAPYSVCSRYGNCSKNQPGQRY